MVAPWWGTSVTARFIDRTIAVRAVHPRAAPFERRKVVRWASRARYAALSESLPEPLCGVVRSDFVQNAGEPASQCCHAPVFADDGQVSSR
jgi:hypothetical protein